MSRPAPVLLSCLVLAAWLGVQGGRAPLPEGGQAWRMAALTACARSRSGSSRSHRPDRAEAGLGGGLWLRKFFSLSRHGRLPNCRSPRPSCLSRDSFPPGGACRRVAGLQLPGGFEIRQRRWRGCPARAVAGVEHQHLANFLSPDLMDSNGFSGCGPALPGHTP